MTQVQEMVVSALQEINVELKGLEQAKEYETINTNVKDLKFYVNVDGRIAGSLISLNNETQEQLWKIIRKICKKHGLTTRYPWDWHKCCWEKSELIIEMEKNIYQQKLLQWREELKKEHKDLWEELYS